MERSFSKTYRNGILKVRGDKCEVCENESREILQIHHITQLSDGGIDTMNNITVLCPNCHRTIHALSEEKNGSEIMSKLPIEMALKFKRIMQKNLDMINNFITLQNLIKKKLESGEGVDDKVLLELSCEAFGERSYEELANIYLEEALAKWLN